MAKTCSLCEHVTDLLAPLGDVRVRPMFGGYGVYRADLMFGVIDDDVLYLKADDETRARYTERGLRPFTYPSPKGPMATSYYEAPPETLDDGEALQAWARAAIEAAARARASKPARAKKPSAPSTRTAAPKSTKRPAAKAKAPARSGPRKPR